MSRLVCPDRELLQPNGISKAGNVGDRLCRGPQVPGRLDFPTGSEELRKLFSRVVNVSRLTGDITTQVEERRWNVTK